MKYSGLTFKVSISLLILLSILTIGFSLLSGSEDYGGGINGVIKNSPNALPWVLLLLLTLFSIKKRKIGGLLIFVLGVFGVYFFNFSGSNFWWSTFALTALIPVLGLLIFFSYKAEFQ